MKSLKLNVLGWIDLHYHNFLLIEKGIGDFHQYFKIEGFADEPKVYVKSTLEGLEFGFEATQWDGPIPAALPGVYKKHLLPRKTLHSLSKEEQQEKIAELLIMTINSRKRQYRKCQFCGKKVSKEHCFDQETCHSCATVHFGVLY